MGRSILLPRRNILLPQRIEQLFQIVISHEFILVREPGWWMR
jgi:hypothetical protein